MANGNLTISLPAGVAAPSPEDIQKAKNYVLMRSQMELALASAIDTVLEKYVGLITRACYKYNIDPQDFTFAANEQLRQEVYALLDELEEEVFALIEEYVVPEKQENKHHAALISWMLSLGTHNWNFRNTLGYYVHRFMQDMEAGVAALRFAGVKQTMAITKLRSALHAPYSMAEMIAAIKSGRSFASDMIRSGGTKTDPFTHLPAIGLSKVGATNITNMAGATLSMVWMRSLFLEAEDEGKQGYYVFRGSSYICPSCDAECGFFHPIKDGYVLPVHNRCRCYMVFVNSEEERPTQYRPLNFH